VFASTSLLSQAFTRLARPNFVIQAKWWRFRLPGSGVIDWSGFFTALADAGYSGGLNIENEDQFYYPSYEGDNFTDAFKEGYRVAHAYVRQFVPPGARG
jgi:sugar phosphate isomerase/epimerase